MTDSQTAEVPKATHLCGNAQTGDNFLAAFGNAATCLLKAGHFGAHSDGRAFWGDYGYAATDPRGVWVVTCHDMTEEIHGIFPNELDAHRCANRNRHFQPEVKFREWGGDASFQ